MSKTNPVDRKYSREHEWARDDGDGTVTVGITDYAQEMLTDIVFVELPAIGKVVRQMDPFAVVESVKSVSDVYAPVAGSVVAVNEKLAQAADLLNKDPHGEGWIVRLKMTDASAIASLMTAGDYEKYLEGLEA